MDTDTHGFYRRKRRELRGRDWMATKGRERTRKPSGVGSVEFLPHGFPCLPALLPTGMSALRAWRQRPNLRGARASLRLYFGVWIKHFTPAMRRAGINSLIAIWLMFLAAQPGLRAQTTNAAPDFKEVYDLVRAHLTGMSEAELNRVVVQGLVSALGPKVSLLAEAAATNAPAETPPVSKSSLFDGDIAYVRVGRVADGLAQAVGEACRKFGATNKVKGVVMDLRYARGDDYAAAAATADLFLKKERPLLNWGNGVVKSKEKNDAITWPAAVLVNRQTTGAAEALAAVLRDAGAGLILGSKTAGQALVAQEFPLKNGQRLRIATAPVQLGDGTTLSVQGLKPDIAVDVNPEDEKAYFGDAFKLPPRAELFAGAEVGLLVLDRK